MKSKPVFFFVWNAKKVWAGQRNLITIEVSFFVWPLSTDVCQKFWRWKHVVFIISDILFRTCFIGHKFLFNLKKFRNQIPRNNSKMELSRDILKPVELWFKIMVLLTCFGVGVPLVGNFLELDLVNNFFSMRNFCVAQQFVCELSRTFRIQFSGFFI